MARGTVAQLQRAAVDGRRAGVGVRRRRALACRCRSWSTTSSRPPSSVGAARAVVAVNDAENVPEPLPAPMVRFTSCPRSQRAGVTSPAPLRAPMVTPAGGVVAEHGVGGHVYGRRAGDHAGGIRAEHAGVDVDGAAEIHGIGAEHFGPAAAMPVPALFTLITPEPVMVFPAMAERPGWRSRGPCGPH